MRVALCQINTTVGDLSGNRARALEAVRRAARDGAELALLPELTLTGYPPRDLLDRSAFVDDNLRALEQLTAELPPETAALVGFVDRRDGRDGPSRALYNAVALIRGGAVQQVFCKRLLPTYDVFDEDRYFESGTGTDVFELSGTRFGVTICEDVWNAVEGPLRRHYDVNPVADLVAAGARVLINIAASPFNLVKREARPQMLAAIAQTHRLPLLFVNLVGGNDDLLFDGSSALYGPDGSEWAAASSFAEHVLVCEIAPSQPSVPRPSSAAGAALQALVMGTRDYAQKCGFSSAVLGLSGGIDSALVAAIAARALGPKHVLGVAMPTRYSSEGSLRDARLLAEGLGIDFRVISIDAIFQRYLDVLRPELEALGPAPEGDATFENLQARIRGNTLMAISNRFGQLLLTTGNKSEIAVGYCTLYGDMAGGLAVISDLPKTFVYEVARAYNREVGRDPIPENSFTKAPSAELRPDQKDEDSLPPYARLDPVLERLVEDGQSSEQVIAQGFDRALVERVAGMVQRNEYKRRQMPPGLIVTRKAFGPGRRYPIAQRYRG
jgi:NAD+ synthase (glutamine-hydrolysing)